MRYILLHAVNEHIVMEYIYLIIILTYLISFCINMLSASNYAGGSMRGQFMDISNMERMLEQMLKQQAEINGRLSLLLSEHDSADKTPAYDFDKVCSIAIQKWFNPNGTIKFQVRFNQKDRSIHKTTTNKNGSVIKNGHPDIPTRSVVGNVFPDETVGAGTYEWASSVVEKLETTGLFIDNKMLIGFRDENNKPANDCVMVVNGSDVLDRESASPVLFAMQLNKKPVYIIVDKLIRSSKYDMQYKVCNRSTSLKLIE